MCELSVGWFSLGYWAEDFAPSFDGPDGYYVYWGQDPYCGPFATKAAAYAEIRAMKRQAEELERNHANANRV